MCTVVWRVSFQNAKQLATIVSFEDELTTKLYNHDDVAAHMNTDGILQLRSAFEAWSREQLDGDIERCPLFDSIGSDHPCLSISRAFRQRTFLQHRLAWIVESASLCTTTEKRFNGLSRRPVDHKPILLLRDCLHTDLRLSVACHLDDSHQDSHQRKRSLIWSRRNADRED